MAERTQDECERMLRAELETLAGQVVLANRVGVYREEGASEMVSCDPPAVVRVLRGEQEASSVWNGDHLDSTMTIEVLIPHPAFEGCRPSWVEGPSYGLDGSVEPGPALQGPGIQASMAEAPGLPRVAGGAFSPAARRIEAMFVRMQVENPGCGLERETEFDRIAFDATHAVLAMPLEEIHLLRDRRDGTDALLPGHPMFAPIEGPRAGGTDVLAVDGVTRFFGVTELRGITQGMLEEARAEMRMTGPALAPEGPRR